MRLVKHCMLLLLSCCFCSFAFAQCTPTFKQVESIGELSNISGRVSDVDADGDLDIVLTNYVGPARVWFNDGNANFVGGAEFGQSLAFNFVVSDFNSDSFPDLFIPSNGDPARTWLNLGDGTFEQSPQEVNAFANNAGAGDFDADGRIDLFCGWYTDVENAVAVNVGDGLFNFPKGGATSLSRTIVTGDLDNDGDLDALLAQGVISQTVPNLVLLNNEGNLELTEPDGFGFQSASDAELADLDGDGDLDAFITNFSPLGIPAFEKVWLNDGTGAFADSGQIFTTSGALDVELSDIDSDGDIDALVIEQGGPQRIWFNDGSANFDRFIVISDLFNASQGLLGDFDGDDDIDVAIISFSGTELFLNTTSNVGDINLDGMVNLLDVSAFVELIGNGQYQCQADINGDAMVNLLDVDPFIGLLSGN